MPGEKDFAIGSVGVPTGIGAVSKKPPYLVALENPSGKGKLVHFISLDKPDLLNGFIQAKGIYVEVSETKVIKTFSEIIAETPKEEILDMMFPWHRVHSIRSLVFNANKPVTLLRNE